MLTLLRLLQLSRHSNRLIQSVLLAFVLNLGVVTLAPALQAQQLSPDQQMICVGAGGMKLVTFAADGTVSDVQTTSSHDCPLCMVLLAPPPATQTEQGLPPASSAKPIFTGLAGDLTFQSRAPPARGPPAI